MGTSTTYVKKSYLKLFVALNVQLSCQQLSCIVGDESASFEKEEDKV